MNGTTSVWSVNGGMPPLTAKYTLTVSGGAGSYQAGAVVSIIANAPVSGYVFSKWVANPSGAQIAHATSANITLTMPASGVTMTANYAPIATYALTVNGGPVVVAIEREYLSPSPPMRHPLGKCSTNGWPILPLPRLQMSAIRARL